MAVTNKTITMYIDSHQELEFQITDVENLMGASVKWSMSKEVDSAPLIEKTTEIQVGTNSFVVPILPTDNKDLTTGTYYHEARITDASGNTRPVAKGRIEVEDTLTESGD